MYRLYNIVIGFASVIPGIIMAIGAWQYFQELPLIPILLGRSVGAFVVISVVAAIQTKKDIKKVSQLGISIGFIWMLTAMILKLEI
tara:strand:+ start:533 stop:790 length:258 start_codon:yes stop_codon:yes gene_type:complete